MHGLGIQDNVGHLVRKSLCQVQIKERKGYLSFILWVINQIPFSVLLEIGISEDWNAGLISSWLLDYDTWKLCLISSWLF